MICACTFPCGIYVSNSFIFFIFQALVGSVLQIPTLDGGKIPLKLNDVTKPNTAKRIAGQGLPMPKQPTRRGDMIIEFDIVFPDRLSSSAKEILADTLPRTNFQ